MGCRCCPGGANPPTSGLEALCHCPQLELPSRLHCRGGLQGRKQSSPSRQACRRDLVNKRPHLPTEPCPPVMAQRQEVGHPSARVGGGAVGEGRGRCVPEVTGPAPLPRGPSPSSGNADSSTTCRPLSDGTPESRGSTPTPLLFLLALPGLPQSPALGHRPGEPVNTGRRKASPASPGGCHTARGPAGVGPMGTRGGGRAQPEFTAAAGTWAQLAWRAGCTGHLSSAEPASPHPP